MMKNRKTHKRHRGGGTGSSKPSSRGDTTYNKMIPIHLFNTKNDLLHACLHWVRNQSEAINKYGPIQNWNITYITDLSDLFNKPEYRNFNGDISKWNTSNVTNMSRMFKGCQVFNGDISKWNTSKVTDMSHMFEGCLQFNQPISFNTSKVTDMSHMFEGCRQFNQPFKSPFTTINVTNMISMFGNCTKFNQSFDPNIFITNKLKIIEDMFRDCTAFTDLNTGHFYSIKHFKNIGYKPTHNGHGNFIKIDGYNYSDMDSVNKQIDKLVRKCKIEIIVYISHKIGNVPTNLIASFIDGDKGDSKRIIESLMKRQNMHKNYPEKYLNLKIKNTNKTVGKHLKESPQNILFIANDKDGKLIMHDISSVRFINNVINYNDSDTYRNWMYVMDMKDNIYKAYFNLATLLPRYDFNGIVSAKELLNLLKHNHIPQILELSKTDNQLDTVRHIFNDDKIYKTLWEYSISPYQKTQQQNNPDIPPPTPPTQQQNNPDILPPPPPTQQSPPNKETTVGGNKRKTHKTHKLIAYSKSRLF